MKKIVTIGLLSLACVLYGQQQPLQVDCSKGTTVCPEDKVCQCLSLTSDTVLHKNPNPASDTTHPFLDQDGVAPTSVAITRMGVGINDDDGKPIVDCWFKPNGDVEDCKLAPGRTLDELMTHERKSEFGYADAWMAEKKNSEVCRANTDYITRQYEALEKNRREVIRQYKKFIKEVKAVNDKNIQDAKAVLQRK